MFCNLHAKGIATLLSEAISKVRGLVVNLATPCRDLRWASAFGEKNFGFNAKQSRRIG